MNLDELMHVRRLPQPSAEGWRRWIDIYTAAAGVRYRGVTFDDGRAGGGAVRTTVGLQHG